MIFGIGKITLVDFDNICLTNVNRKIHALSSTAGQQKVSAMVVRLQDINPAAEIIPILEFISQENAVRLQELLGHALLSTSQKYTHISIDHLMEV